VITLQQAHRIAASAHHGQTDKIGVPYLRHVQDVAMGLRPFSMDVQIAGLLHDVVEDSSWTLDRLRRAGVPEVSVRIIDAVTKQPGTSKDEQIDRVIRGGYKAILVKVADNAHNTRPDRMACLDSATHARLQKKYRTAREKLWREVEYDDVDKILKIVNPALVGDLSAFNRAPRPDILTKDVVSGYFDGKTVLDLSAEFNCSPGTIVVRLRKGRKEFAELPWDERDGGKVREYDSDIRDYVGMNDGKPGQSRLREGSVIRGHSLRNR
jgi:hypothetical protein